MGPSFAPVPAKLVGQIVPRKFVELSDLLQANIAQSESEPKLVFDSRMILTSNPKRSRKKIDDIVTQYILGNQTSNWARQKKC